MVTIFYEDDCGFCKKASYFISRILCIEKKVRIRPASEEPTAHRLLTDHDSWVIMNPAYGKVWTIEYEALLSLLILSPWAKYLTGLFSLPLSKWMGRKIYRLIGNHRPRTCL